MIRTLMLVLTLFAFAEGAEAPIETVLTPSGAPWPTRMRPVQLKERPVTEKKEAAFPAESKEGNWWIPALVTTGAIGGGTAAIAIALGSEEVKAETLGSGRTLTFIISNSDSTDGTVGEITTPTGATTSSFSVPGSGSYIQSFANAIGGGYTATLTTLSSPIGSYALTVQIDSVTVATQGFSGTPATSSYTFTP